MALHGCAWTDLFGSDERPLWQAHETTYFHRGFAAGPVMITRADGTIEAERRTEPFGQGIDEFSQTPGGGSVVAPIDYAREPLNALNKSTDPSTGWSYHGARWMAPQVATWTAPDPPVKAPDPKFMAKPWALHPYQYVEQNPVVFWDPDGLDATTAGKGVRTSADDDYCPTGLEGMCVKPEDFSDWTNLRLRQLREEHEELRWEIDSMKLLQAELDPLIKQLNAIGDDLAWNYWPTLETLGRTIGWGSVVVTCIGSSGITCLVSAGTAVIGEFAPKEAAGMAVIYACSQGAKDCIQEATVAFSQLLASDGGKQRALSKDQKRGVVKDMKAHARGLRRWIRHRIEVAEENLIRTRNEDRYIRKHMRGGHLGVGRGEFPECGGWESKAIKRRQSDFRRK